MTTPSFLITPLVAGLLAVGLGACGEGNAETGGGPDAPKGPNAEVADDKAELAFVKCLREKGVEASQPDGEGNGVRIQLSRKPGENGGLTPRKLQAATKECRDKTGGGPPEPTEAQKTEMRDQALKFAKCMRDHGIDMPDPQFEGGGAIISRSGGKSGGGGIDPASPAFQKAEKACADLMPRLRSGNGPSTSNGGPDEPGTAGDAAEIVVPAP